MPRSGTCARHLATALVIAGTLTACGSSGGPGPGPQGGTRTDTFSGTSAITANGGCSGGPPGGHSITTSGAGQIVIAITQASLPATGVQVCHPTAQNHALECTVPPFARVAAGASITATLRGGAAQTVAVFPDGCGAAATPATLNYTFTVTYPF